MTEVLLERASEADDPLAKEVLEGTTIELTTRASDLLAKMEVARAVSIRQRESANARRQEMWGGFPREDALLLELAAKLPSHIQGELVAQWFKNVGS